jgi:mannosyltransferase OCH1-like enzyme
VIPKLIHQTWKSSQVPAQWIPFVQKVKELNPGWKYQLWTDADNDAFVKTNFPEFYPVFKGFSREIMRADVIRYLIMYKSGGVYLDLDYEVLAPFDFGNHQLVLPFNRSKAFGDAQDDIGNCFFASEPGHPFWADVIRELSEHPPVVTDYTQIVEATGPRLLTRVYNQNKYENIYLPDRLVYHPPSPKNKKEADAIRTNGISLGIHHTWGSWKERWSMAYLKTKLKKIFG